MKRPGVVVLASALLVACGRGRAQSQADTTSVTRPDVRAESREPVDSARVTPTEIALGDSVFNGTPNKTGICATCHGLGGVGTKAAPSLRDTVWINGDGSLGFIEGTVYQGVPEPKEHPLPMPNFGRTLTDRQWHAVSAYVYSLSHPSH